MSYDASIVGAGPGGLYIARALSEKGIRTLVLEKNKDTKAVCGELTNKHTLDVLGLTTNSEIVSNTLRRTEIVILDGNLDAKATMEVPGKVTGETYLLDSDLLKKYLKEGAESNGAVFEFGTHVTDVTKTGGFISGLRTPDRTFESDVTVGSDGSTSIVAKKAGFDVTGFKGSPTVKYKLNNCKGLDPETAYFFLSEKIGLGYLWLYPRSETEANVGIGSFKPNAMVSILGNFIRKKPELQGAKIYYRGGDIVPCSGLLPKFTGNGILLVGDAAGQVSNLIGGGVSTTLDGAKMASETMLRAVESRDFSEAFLRKYEENYRNSDVGKHVQRTAKDLSTIIKFSEKKNIFNLLDMIVQHGDPEIVYAFVGGDYSKTTLVKAALRHPLLTLSILKALISS